jgi:hypothetical protein
MHCFVNFERVTLAFEGMGIEGTKLDLTIIVTMVMD